MLCAIGSILMAEDARLEQEHNVQITSNYDDLANRVHLHVCVFDWRTFTGGVERSGSE